VLDNKFPDDGSQTARAHFGAGEGEEYFGWVINIYTVEPKKV
jgi:hypothetical protein